MSNHTPRPSPARDHSVEKNKPIHKADKGAKKPTGKRKGFMSSNYRTEKCDFYNKGHCAKGDECTYSHDFVPDSARVATSLLRRCASFSWEGRAPRRMIVPTRTIPGATPAGSTTSKATAVWEGSVGFRTKLCRRQGCSSSPQIIRTWSLSSTRTTNFRRQLGQRSTSSGKRGKRKKSECCPQ